MYKGLGIHFVKNSENIYSAQSHSLHPIYIVLKSNEEQILLEPGKFIVFIHIFFFSNNYKNLILTNGNL